MTRPSFRVFVVRFFTKVNGAVKVRRTRIIAWDDDGYQARLASRRDQFARELGILPANIQVHETLEQPAKSR